MTRVFWDTNIFIYLFEGGDERAKQSRSLLERMKLRRYELATSPLVVGELMAGPLRAGDLALANLYERLVPGEATIFPFNLAAARAYAEIRRDRLIRPPDALNLACAAAGKTDLFVTNDDRLLHKTVEGIRFIVPLDRVPF